MDIYQITGLSQESGGGGCLMQNLDEISEMVIHLCLRSLGKGAAPHPTAEYINLMRCLQSVCYAAE